MFAKYLSDLLRVCSGSPDNSRTSCWRGQANSSQGWIFVHKGPITWLCICINKSWGSPGLPVRIGHQCLASNGKSDSHMHGTRVRIWRNIWENIFAMCGSVVGAGSSFERHENLIFQNQQSRLVDCVKLLQLGAPHTTRSMGISDWLSGRLNLKSMYRLWSYRFRTTNFEPCFSACWSTMLSNSEWQNYQRLQRIFKIVLEQCLIDVLLVGLRIFLSGMSPSKLSHTIFQVLTHFASRSGFFSMNCRALLYQWVVGSNTTGGMKSLAL